MGPAPVRPRSRFAFATCFRFSTHDVPEGPDARRSTHGIGPRVGASSEAPGKDLSMSKNKNTAVAIVNRFELPFAPVPSPAAAAKSADLEGGGRRVGSRLGPKAPPPESKETVSGMDDDERESTRSESVSPETGTAELDLLGDEFETLDAPAPSMLPPG